MSEGASMPDRLAVDANGFVWRVWDDEPHWSMAPTNPDNEPIPQPVTWFVGDEYATLVRHHRECEHIAEEMSMLLGHVAEGHKPPDLGLRIAHVLGRWENHQWPEFGAVPPPEKDA